MPEPLAATPPSQERRSLQRFLSDVSRLLADTLEPDAALAGIARLAVPLLADGCAIHVPAADGTLRLVALAHADPVREAYARDLGTRNPLPAGDRAGIAGVLHSGLTTVVPDLAATLTGAPRNLAHPDLVRASGLTSYLCAPLVAHGRTLGAVTLYTDVSERRFQPAWAAAFEDAARLIAVALANARLYGEAREAADEAAALHEAALSLAESEAVEGKIARVLGAVVRLVRADEAAIGLLDPTGCWLEYHNSFGPLTGRLFPHDRLRVGEGLDGRVVASGEPALCDDLRANPRAVHRDVVDPLGLRAWVGVPLKVSGRTLGVLVALACRPGAFSARDMRRLESLAALAGAALHEAHLLDAAQQRTRQRDAVLRVARRFAAERDPERVLDELLAQAADISRADIGVVCAWNSAEQVLELVRSTPLPEALRAAIARLPLKGTAIGEALRRREVVVVEDYRTSDYTVRAVAEFGMHAAVYFPLAHEDRLIGVLALGRTDPEARFAEDDVQMLELLAGTSAAVLAGLRHARDLSESLAAQQRAQAEARRAAERLERLLEGTSDAIIACDLERRVLWWNGGAERLYGWQRDEVLFRPIPTVPPECDGVHAETRAVAELGAEMTAYETLGLTRDGRRVPVLVSFSPLRDASGAIEGVLSITKDLTHLRHLREQDARLAMLEERERIAMELHDGVVQSLYALSLEFLARRLRASRPGAERPAEAEAFRGAAEQVAALIGEIRGYVGGLRAGGRRELRAMLEEEAARARIVSGLPVRTELDAAADRGLATERAAEVLQVAREAISNAVRHARASSLSVRLHARQGRLVLTIRDDGSGFGPAQRRSGGDGLRNMRTRARRLGGRLSISSRAGAGTEVRLSIPC